VRILDIFFDQIQYNNIALNIQWVHVKIKIGKNTMMLRTSNLPFI
jgi:hypothetical protein